MSETIVSHADTSTMLSMRAGRRAKSIRQFAEDWDLGESTVWKLIRERRLRAVKVGTRTLIRDEDEEAYARNLPPVGATA